MLVKLGIFQEIGVKTTNIWNHHPVLDFGPKNNFCKKLRWSVMVEIVGDVWNNDFHWRSLKRGHLPKGRTKGHTCDSCAWLGSSSGKRSWEELKNWTQAKAMEKWSKDRAKCMYPSTSWDVCITLCLCVSYFIHGRVLASPACLCDFIVSLLGVCLSVFCWFIGFSFALSSSTDSHIYEFVHVLFIGSSVLIRLHLCM